jgi:hypothetical protein
LRLIYVSVTGNILSRGTLPEDAYLIFPTKPAKRFADKAGRGSTG